MKKLLSLTGIRAVAALWVIIYHININFPSGLHNLFIDKGYLGVDMFFILSGFIISYVHQHEFLTFPSPQTIKFLILRCARILPVHYFMLFTYVFFFFFKSIVLHQPSDSPEKNTFIDFIYHLFNIQAWGLAGHNSWNGPAWSVSAEWFAYLMFPVLTPFIARISGFKNNILLIVACFAFLAGFTAVLHLPTIDWTHRFGLVRVTSEFIIGCALLNIYKQVGEQPKLMETLSKVALIGLVSAIGFQLPDIVPVACIALLIFSLTDGNTLLTRVLSSRPLVYLGEVSYSIYMVHSLFIMGVIQADRRLHLISSEPSLQNILVYLGITVGIIVSAQLMYHFIEVPSRNFIRSLMKKENPMQQNAIPA